MTLELILFVAAILFGLIWYWRESKGNSLYRFFDKLMNSKELQMKAADTKGFVYNQPFVLRLVFVSVLFLVAIVIIRFLIPIDFATISAFASMIVGTLIGTYIAGGIFKSSEIIDEHTDSIGDLVQNTIEKGKDFIEDLKSEEKEEVKEEIKSTKEQPEEEKKSARERLKDKGYL
ncbi:hypothetical protein [Tenacibaculum agarivorans]|uniref:hypothetical protein n=1 Tax=Tenacibaculum agarivorans TaxID=1908389 RepID=UPI00094B855C|nr:hypothetical protein [Tenacibaculum agarivorans]